MAHIMVRIKGKNTIEMLKALTELETIQVGMSRSSLLKKNSNGFRNSENVGKINGSVSMGLSAFIEKKEYCSTCKHHMILTKNQRGTAYLRCSNKNCNEMKYLTADLMNWYINNNAVSCPRNDGGDLKGIIGKYGPCVKCSRGHFLKPEEI